MTENPRPKDRPLIGPPLLSFSALQEADPSDQDTRKAKLRTSEEVYRPWFH